MIEAEHPVLLGGIRVGSLLQRGDVARFVFIEDYWTDPDRRVLGLWFEDDPRRSPQAALRLPPWFSNLLPEGALRDWIARDRGVSAQRELQLLLEVGHDLPGAVEVESGADDAPLHDLHALVGDPVEHASPAQLSPWKFSLAGVQLKFSMLRDGDRLTIPSSGSMGDWIVKFPDARHRNVAANEFATMHLAGQMGIEVPEIELVDRTNLPTVPDVMWPEGETEAYAIKRFDRLSDGRRVHIEDLAQVRGFYPDRKYEGSFETVAALAYRGADAASLQEFVRRMTFMLLVGNGDAHLKNWSLIYRDGRQPALSPAYDIVATGPYYDVPPDNLGLKFGRTRVFDRVTRVAFERLQHRLGVGNSDVLRVLDETLERFVEAWRDNGFDRFPEFVADWIDARLEATVQRLASDH